MEQNREELTPGGIGENNQYSGKHSEKSNSAMILVEAIKMVDQPEVEQRDSGKEERVPLRLYAQRRLHPPATQNRTCSSY